MVSVAVEPESLTRKSREGSRRLCDERERGESTATAPQCQENLKNRLYHRFEFRVCSSRTAWFLLYSSLRICLPVHRTSPIRHRLHRKATFSTLIILLRWKF